MTRPVPSSAHAGSPVAVPRLSWRTGLWSVAFSFSCVTAFSTLPSSLYGLYEKQEGFSSLTVTLRGRTGWPQRGRTGWPQRGN
jgi:hypothetical protein